MKFWERRDGESEVAFAAFEFWNSHPKYTPITPQFVERFEAAKGYKTTVWTVRGWMTDHEWKARRKAYIQWRTDQKIEKEAESIIREASLIVKQHTRVRRLSMRKAVSTLAKLKSIEPVDAKDCDTIFAGTLKAMQIAGIGMLDHADQLRRVSKGNGLDFGVRNVTEDDELPEIPDGAGEIQPGSSETSGLLGETASDLQSCGGSEDPNGSGSIG